MASKPTQETPTELECCVLGILEEEAPCTAYVVRRRLAVSKSSFWSASSGAIYPLLERLEARGLVTVEERPWGSGHRRLFRLARRGQTQLRRWLSPPIAPATAAYTFDPIRTRVFFLESVPPKTRLAFVDAAIRGTEDTIEEHRVDMAAERESLTMFEVLGREGAIDELKAKLGWLRRVRVALET